MNFKGKYEQIVETTLGRYQQGGIMAGDIVKIKGNALNHPKVKEMSDNMKGNIKMLMDTDLHLTVSAVKSIRDSRGDMGDGLGLGSTTAPTDFWVDVCVNHSPGFKGDPVTLPIEVLEKQDFGANLPPIPDSQKRIGNVNIKPVDATEYKTRMGESMEDIYSDMQQPEQVTVRVPLEDSEEVYDVFDKFGITYSLIGTNRFELHGTMDNIQQALNATSEAGAEGVEIEVVGTGDIGQPTQQIPNETGIPDAEKPEKPSQGEETVEEAYARLMTGEPKTRVYTIAIPNAFADNVKTYLAHEGVSNMATVDGNLTYIDIVSASDEIQIETAIKDNVMGDLTYLKVYKSDAQS
jgi:hypothetical protein